MKKDIYKTLAKPTDMVLLKERKSKFYGYAFPLNNEDEVRPRIEELQKKYPAANHFCYAWQLGINKKTYRTNDDGEPNNSAGAPIYGQILSYDVTNILVVVIRIFGGTKLGVGGLIGAYKECAKLTLEKGKIVTRTLKHEIHIRFDYEQMSTVMRFIKQHDLSVVDQKMAEDCLVVVSVRKRHAPVLMEKLRGFHKLNVSLMP
jgi:uncharacterized YigZ family protein